MEDKNLPKTVQKFKNIKMQALIRIKPLLPNENRAKLNKNIKIDEVIL